MPVAAAEKPSTTSSTKSRTRVARRRGRGPTNSLSDDEIEREVGTDSDSSSDGESSDSDTEPASEGLKDQEPEPSFFGQSGAGNWGDMVDAENENGPSGLPVIDFADLDGSTAQSKPKSVQGRPPPVKKSAKQQTKQKQPIVSVPAPAPSSDEEETPRAAPETPVDNSGRPSARQAYQDRLEKDPSYVPTVGEFWGHDDRLLDKDLRSLSGWWRGKWQGGRGRGMRGGMRGSFGRGGMRGGAHQQAPVDVPPREIPAVDRTWTHDGFEELQRRRPSPAPFRGGPPGIRGAPVRGRGTFVPRGGRGGVTSRHAKAENSWTKPAESFLHFDQSLKPRPGSGPAFRVKLSGEVSGEIVRGPPKAYLPRLARKGKKQEEGQGEYFVVRIPKRAGKEKAKEEIPVAPVADAVSASEETTMVPPVAETVPPSLEEIFTVRLNMAEKPSFIPPPSEDYAPTLPPAFQPQHSRTQSQSQSSPYTLPPGIAIDQNGMTYEYQTGRPVYLQGPPPPPIFNPRPMLPPAFVPGHSHHHSSMSHHSMSSPGPSSGTPPWLPTTQTPPYMGTQTPPYMDPSMFVMPRQNSRVQIRAPGVDKSAAPSEQEQQQQQQQPVYEEEQQQDNGYYAQQHNPYAYQQYQQGFYYPQPAYGGGGYAQGGYEMYPPQGTTYY